MKRYLFIIMVLLPFYLTSCGGDDSTESDYSEESLKKNVEIKVSDEVIGLRQIVEFSVNYQTDNPNFLVTWYVDGEKLNSIPRAELSTTWKANNVGEHLIEVAITDKEQVLKYQKSINVVETEFGDAIIGDKKSKIARTFGSAETDDVITYKQSSVRTYRYYFVNDVLTKIYYEYAVSLTPRNKTDYMIPVTTFSSAYVAHKEKYGEPVRENFTQLETSESKIMEYGGHIYSGGMSIQALFQNGTRISEIYVGPYRSGFGFTYTETLEKR